MATPKSPARKPAAPRKPRKPAAKGATAARKAAQKPKPENGARVVPPTHDDEW